MAATIQKRSDCRVCGGTRLDLIIPLVPTPLEDDFVPAGRLAETQQVYPLDVYLCADCGLAQLLDVVDPGAIYNEYLYVTQSSPGLAEHFDAYANDLVSRLGLEPGAFVVEIGSNDGTLLQSFAKRGMRVLGVDPAPAAALANQAGVETLRAWFTPELARRIRAERRSADLIVANNVMANIDDLSSAAVAFRELLSPSGAITVETGYLGGIAHNMVFDNIYHEHLSYYSARPLQSYFAGHGMQMFDLQHVPTKGGSIRAFAQIAGGPRSTTSEVTRTLAAERGNGMFALETYRALCAKLLHLRASLAEVLDRARAEGKTIAGYGASHSTTTLTYHFQVAPYLSFIADDNPRKQHLYSPGHHLPVLPASALMERRPDYVVILPWRFASMIANRNQAFTAAGGRFVVPVPETRIL